MAEIRVGISGWRYAGWRGDFYPKGLRQRDELAYAAERLGSIELNGSFYSLQRPTSYQSWRRETPDGFIFAVKGGRFITHMKRLADVDTALANFFASGVLALEDKLGPVLWQLPERLAFDADLLESFFAKLPRTTIEAARQAEGHDDKVPDDRACTTTSEDRPIRHALEPRHKSFDTDEARELLSRNDICMVLADSAGKWPAMGDGTSDFRYVRLHGDTELYASGYSPSALDRWAGLCCDWQAEGHDVFVYFDNDAKGHAPHDAMQLQERVTQRSQGRRRRGA
jgi:uncharacterized protein YecE (DUF72 family)